ncbi:MAG TPA: extracellular solute-binding protein [Anaerolineaceae bacterium]|nr:extracellular solute-binding protein [Anaerolineaceae bacterium]
MQKSQIRGHHFLLPDLRLSALALMFCLSLVACSPAPNPPTSTVNPKAAATRTVAPTRSQVRATTIPAMPAGTSIPSAKLHGLKVHFWYAWSGNASATVEKLTSEFNATNSWGIWVTPTRFDSYADLFAAAAPLFGKPTQPDVIIGSIEQALLWNSEQDRVVDLTPFLQDPEYGMNSREILDFPAGIWEGDAWNGLHLGIPAERSVRLMAYNQTWAKELGFSKPPTTLDEFESQVCAAEKAVMKDGVSENNGMGGWLIDGDPDTAAAWALAFDAQLNPAKPGDPYKFHTPQMETAFQTLRRLFDKGCIWLGRNPDPSEYFLDRRALLITLQSQDLPGLTAALTNAGNQDVWTVLPFPTRDGKPAVMVNGPSYFLLRSEAEQELAAWLFIRWISAPEQQARLAEAGSWAPLRKSTAASLKGFAAEHPQWKAAADLTANARPSPAQASWRSARLVLGDAFLQLFSADTQPNRIPYILDQLDATIRELLEKGSS